MDQNDGAHAKGIHGRPLGRGLEDVSHLFLTQKTRDVPVPTDGSVSATVLRPVRVTRERLAGMLPLDWSDAFEDGLRTVDTKIPCHPWGEIDVLAVDRTGKLTVMDFDMVPNDGLLLRGIAHVDWITRNTPLIQRLHPGQAFDSSLTPRLVLLAPQFSALLRRGIRQMTRPQIHAIRYHAVDTTTGAGILFEVITGE